MTGGREGGHESYGKDADIAREKQRPPVAAGRQKQLIPVDGSSSSSLFANAQSAGERCVGGVTIYPKRRQHINLLSKSPQLHIGLLQGLHGCVAASDWCCAASLDECHCLGMRQPVFARDALGFKLFKAGNAVVVLIVVEEPLQVRGGANVCEYRGERAGARGIGGRQLAGCAHFSWCGAAEGGRCSPSSIGEKSF
jgi:hypothetical protein